jgi:hypothetical protein
MLDPPLVEEASIFKIADTLVHIPPLSMDRGPEGVSSARTAVCSGPLALAISVVGDDKQNMKNIMT